jgi:hypothetical protein
MRRLILALTLCVLSACSNTVQSSSGAAFLADRGPITDAEIAKAAAGEPTLHFPAKIGIARIIGRDITAIPQGELSALTKERPTPDPLGQFVPLSSMIAQTIERETNTTAIRLAQLTAAHQHLDYVIIYDLSREGRGFDAMGRADLMVMDVRSGYIYAAAVTSTNVAGLGTIRRGWADRILSDAAAEKLVKTLAPDVTSIFTTLYQRAQ